MIHVDTYVHTRNFLTSRGDFIVKVSPSINKTAEKADKTEGLESHRAPTMRHKWWNDEQVRINQVYKQKTPLVLGGEG